MNINQLVIPVLGLSLANVLTTLAVLVIGLLLIRFIIKRLGRRLEGSGKIDTSLARFIVKLLHALLIFVLAIICAGQLGLPVTSLVTILGALGLAVSLALQDSLKNLAGGIFLLTTRPFATGHFVELGDVSGTVEEVGIIHTVLTTADNRRIFIPNGTVSGSTVVNYSIQQTRRLELVFPVPYACDTAQAKAVITGAVLSDRRVNAEPEPFIRVWQVNAASVEIMVRVWTASADYWELRSSLLEAVKTALDRSGMSVPPAQTTVIFRQDDGK